MKEESLELMSGPEMLDSMDTFCVALSQQMDVNYVSNNVCNHVGLTALELMGQPFYDYIHPCDHSQLKTVVNLSGGESKEVYIRIKVTVTERGRLINLRQANYKVIKLSGRVRSFRDAQGSRRNVFLGLCHLIGQASKEELFNKNQFPLSRPFQTSHTSDMKFLDINPMLSSVGKYPLGYLEGMSYYEFIHLEDIHKIVNGFKNLYEQGQCEIAPYRFLIAGGGWIWLETKADLAFNRKQRIKGNIITCTHIQISEVINKGDIVAMVQLVTKEENYRKEQKTKNLTSHSPALALTKPNYRDHHYLSFSKCFTSLDNTRESTLLNSLCTSPETDQVASLCSSPLGSLHATPVISPIPSLQITPEINHFDNVHIIREISPYTNLHTPPETTPIKSELSNPFFLHPTPENDLLSSLRTTPDRTIFSSSPNSPTASPFLAHQDISIYQSQDTPTTLHSLHPTSSVIKAAKKYRTISANVTSNESVPEMSETSDEQGTRIPSVISMGTTESYPILANVSTESLLKERSSVIVYSSSLRTGSPHSQAKYASNILHEPHISNKIAETSPGCVTDPVENQYKPDNDGNDNVEIEFDEKDTLSSLSNPDLYRSFYKNNLDGHMEQLFLSSSDDVTINKDEQLSPSSSDDVAINKDEQLSLSSSDDKQRRGYTL